MKTIIKNSPELWQKSFPNPKPMDHKYKRGHLFILGAPKLIGATRLAAMGALKSGVGLVSVIAKEKADIYRSTLPPDIMVTSEFDFSDTRISALLVGSGGVDRSVAFNLNDTYGFPIIQDSGALPKANDFPLSPLRILTPHGGEFAKLFPDLNSGDSNDVMKAAKRFNAIIVAKGAETFVAEPSGSIVFHKAPNPALARAGTGDVLSGLIAGLIAQHMPPFEAACAAVWIHSEAANGKGHSFTASDLVVEIGHVIDQKVG